MYETSRVLFDFQKQTYYFECLFFRYEYKSLTMSLRLDANLDVKCDIES